MRAVLEASRQVARSRRLRKLLELVLALGNYVNRGNARGNACGFRLASLNRLVDTKSSCSKGTTLLHYLVQILESRFREVLDIEEDMPHVRTAARVSMADLQKEVANLKNGLQDVQREIGGCVGVQQRAVFQGEIASKSFSLCFLSEFHRGQSQVLQGDMFLPAMRDFQAQATCRLAEAEDLFQDMKTRVRTDDPLHLPYIVPFLTLTNPVPISIDRRSSTEPSDCSAKTRQVYNRTNSSVYSKTSFKRLPKLDRTLKT